MSGEYTIKTTWENLVFLKKILFNWAEYWSGLSRINRTCSDAPAPGERNWSGPHITPGLSDNVEPS